MREVVFLGFSRRDTPRGKVLAAETWTMNDWYQLYPWLTNPARVYQVHEQFDGKHPHSNRFTGDWRNEYEKSGAQIVTLSGLGFSKERMIDKAALASEFGAGFFGSSFSYMFAEAIREKVDKVTMYGVRMQNSGEHERQVPVTLLNIKIARERGIEVDCPVEREWIEDGAKPAEYNPVWVDWKNLKGVDGMYGSNTNMAARKEFDHAISGGFLPGEFP